MSTFTARCPGRCQECGDDIDTGDLLRYDADDRAVHAECATGLGPMPTPRTVEICPDCHLTTPCDCD